VVVVREIGVVGAACLFLTLVAAEYSSCIVSNAWKNGVASFDLFLYLTMKKDAPMMECRSTHVDVDGGNPVLEVTDVVHQKYTSRHRELCTASTSQTQTCW
jgi:hypothetical protein